MKCRRHRIAFGRRREDGFVTIFILMLAVVLLSLLGVAAHEMALAYAQNRVERQAIEQRAKTLGSPSRANVVPAKHSGCEGKMMFRPSGKDFGFGG